MLIRDDGTSWTAITQPAHAYLAGQLARHWRAPALSDDVVLAIGQHDVPWIAYDRAPPLDPEAQRAAAFVEAPIEERHALWFDVATKLEAQSPYAAVLVSLHATNIHSRYLAEEHRPQDLLANAREHQDRLLALLPDATRDQAERDADVLFALDAASLTLCHRWDPRELPAFDDTTYTVLQDTITPWPFGDATDAVTLELDARTLTERFDDAHELHEALARTPFTRERWRLTRQD